MSFEARWTEELPAETAFAKGDRIVLNPGVELTAQRVHVMRGVTFGKDADAVHVQLLDSPPRAHTSRTFGDLRAPEPGAKDPSRETPSTSPTRARTRSTVWATAARLSGSA